MKALLVRWLVIRQVFEHCQAAVAVCGLDNRFLVRASTRAEMTTAPPPIPMAVCTPNTLAIAPDWRPPRGIRLHVRP